MFKRERNYTGPFIHKRDKRVSYGGGVYEDDVKPGLDLANNIMGMFEGFGIDETAEMKKDRVFMENWKKKIPSETKFTKYLEIPNKLPKWNQTKGIDSQKDFQPWVNNHIKDVKEKRKNKPRGPEYREWENELFRKIENAKKSKWENETNDSKLPNRKDIKVQKNFFV